MKMIQVQQFDDLLSVGLNRPEKLNALNEEMVIELREVISKVKCSAVVVYGASERAFCAGGDVSAVVMRERSKEATFFTHEYAADLALWKLSANLTTLGHGIVMGGGFGLFASGNQRVVSETTVAAMPELSIGFFPDVAAHYFLRKFMSGHYAKFTALTGARLNAREMIELGLATHFVETDAMEELKSSVSALRDLDQLDREYRMGTHYLALENRFVVFKKEIEEFLDCASVETMNDWARSKIEESPKSWFKSTLETFVAGSDLSKYVTLKLFERTMSTTPESAFELDLKIAYWLDRAPDFREGVRALLIDKDKNPSWAPLTDEIKNEIDELLK